MSAETERILLEYRRRDEEIPVERYAPWNPGPAFMLAERRIGGITLLHNMGVRLSRDTRCCEVGFGVKGWLLDLIDWGVPERNLAGIDLDPERASIGMDLLPKADLRVGNARDLPWEDEEFDLVVMSVAMTSIFDPVLRHQVAQEVVRVLKPGGALLWYDFRFNNPFNKNVRKVNRRELKALFPTLQGKIRTITPLPHLCRLIAPAGWFLPAFIELIPLLRTHLLAVLKKPLTPP